MLAKGFERYLASGVYVVAQDAAPEEDMEKHDKRFHPDGYKEGDKCKYREALAKGDTSDLALLDAERKEEKELVKEDLARIRKSEAGMSLKEKRDKRIADAKAKGEPLDFAGRRDAGLRPLFYGIYDENEIVKDCFAENENMGDPESRGWIGGRKIYGYGSIPLAIADSFVEYARSHGGDPDKPIDTPKDLEDAGYVIRTGNNRNELRLMKKVKPTYPHFHNVEDLHFSWRPILPRRAKGTAPKKEKKENFSPSISLSGALPFRGGHYVRKSPGSREILMSDGTFKSYDKLRGNDVPYLAEKDAAEEKAKELGGVAAPDKDLLDET